MCMPCQATIPYVWQDNNFHMQQLSACAVNAVIYAVNTVFDIVSAVIDAAHAVGSGPALRVF